MLKKPPNKDPPRSSPGRYHRHIGGVALPEPIREEEPVSDVPAEGVPDTNKDTADHGSQ
jgi:hypothetical protein